MGKRVKTAMLFLLCVLLCDGTIHTCPVSSEGKVRGQKGLQSDERGTLNSAEKQYLLSLARQTLTQTLAGHKSKTGVLEDLPARLRAKRGCFVTLMKNGNLRGCVGFIAPLRPLCDCVAENAVNAALHDTRFPSPVGPEELKSIFIEISVLTVPEKVELKERSEFLNRLQPGRDGVILKNGWNQSTYLPQVWEDLPDKEQFLDSLCRKGGMAGGCWKDKDTEIFLYQADVFGEERR